MRSLLPGFTYSTSVMYALMSMTPRLIPDPTDEDNLEIPSGRGVMLIKAYMTEVEYVKPGNKLRMALVKPTSP